MRPNIHLFNLNRTRRRTSHRERMTYIHGIRQIGVKVGFANRNGTSKEHREVPSKTHEVTSQTHRNYENAYLSAFTQPDHTRLLTTFWSSLNKLLPSRYQLSAALCIPRSWAMRIAIPRSALSVSTSQRKKAKTRRCAYQCKAMPVQSPPCRTRECPT
jgi:hypothetical protein